MTNLDIKGDKFKEQILNNKLRGIANSVNKNLCLNMNFSESISSKYLDQLCQDIGSENYFRIISNYKRSYSKKNKIDILICSKLALTGGHSSLIDDLVKASKNKIVILITNIGGKTNIKAIRKRYINLKNIDILKSPNGNYIFKLTWLQKKILKLKPQNIWLVNAHEDSIAIAAVQKEDSYQVRFLHHADDKLCLGSSIKHFIHYDTNPNCFYRCRKFNKFKSNIYLPLTALDYGKSNYSKKIPNEGIVSCTIAAFNKLEVTYFINYKDIVHKIIKASKGKHIHVGKLNLINLLIIRFNLFINNIEQKRFVYYSYTSNVWKFFLENKVNVFIGSFPYGAGKTTVMAMGAGLTLILHRHISERIMGGVDLGPSDVLQWTDPRDLFQILSILDENLLKKYSKSSRNHYQRLYSFKKFKRFLYSKNNDLPLLNKFEKVVIETKVNFVNIYLGKLINKLRGLIWYNYRIIKNIFSMYFS